MSLISLWLPKLSSMVLFMVSKNGSDRRESCSYQFPHIISDTYYFATVKVAQLFAHEKNENVMKLQHLTM